MMKVTLIIAALFATCQCKIEFSERPRNFSVELLYFTAQETDWHTVISPLGIWSLLTAASTGATDYSRKQLINTLILPKKEKPLLDGYKSLIQSVLRPSTPKVDLKSMNYMFVDSNYLIKPEFIKNLRQNFDTVIAKLRFKPPEKAQELVNGIIRRSRIIDSNVFQSDDFANAKLILTNIISFKATWQFPFNVTDTKIESFYDESGNEAGKVNMMFQQEYFSYSKLDPIKASVLELPYGDDPSKYSFLILLPYPGETVSGVYKLLDKMTLKDIFAKLDSDTNNYGMSSVLVSLPRFKISTNLILNRPLNNMGIADIFNPNMASFKLISDANDLFVSAIVHKADIEVTEVGTVASAFTSAFFADRITPSTFNANRPFIYFVVEKTTTTIIFSGVYSKPSLF